MLYSNRPFHIRVFNALSFKVKLEAADLMLQAKKKTGLSNFGDGNLEEALKQLIQSIKTEANLHPFGLFITKQRILGILQSRLRIEETFSKHPEIAEIEISKPIFITGLQRTGTTRLHRLLAAHPQLRSLSSWEALNPAPLDNDPSNRKRKAFARTAEKALKFMSPDFFAIHPVEFEAPEEDVLLNDMTFISAVSEATMNVPSYAKWLTTQDQTQAYRFLKKCLQVLHWQKPNERWVLKTPEHLGNLETIYKVFPDALLIHTYRNPLKVIPSFSSMLFYGYRIFSNEVEAHAVARYWMLRNETMLQRAVKFWEEHPNVPVLHISYYNMLNNLQAELEKICKFADLNWNQNVAQQISHIDKRNQQHKYGVHKYSLKDFDLDEAELTSRFEFYRTKFSIPNE